MIFIIIQKGGGGGLFFYYLLIINASLLYPDRDKHRNAEIGDWLKANIKADCKYKKSKILIFLDHHTHKKKIIR